MQCWWWQWYHLRIQERKWHSYSLLLTRCLDVQTDSAFLKVFISFNGLDLFFFEMLRSPDVESASPNPSISTDESQPHTQWGHRLIEFPCLQWTHTQDLRVPVLAFDKQMTPMELRSESAKTRVRGRKIKSCTQTSPISTHPGLSPGMFALCVCWVPVGPRGDSSCLHTHFYTHHPEKDVQALTVWPLSFCYCYLSFLHIWIECMCK